MGMLANRLRAEKLPFGKETSAVVADTAYRLFLSAGLVLPLLKASKKEKVRQLRTLEVLLLSVLGAKGLKEVLPAQRPDALQRNSFPSSHTMNSVALYVR